MNTIALSFVFYTFAIVAFGVYSARYAERTSADFFLAGRCLGPWVAALSSAASAESGWVTLGLVGMSFHIGIGAFWVVPGTVAAMAFNWLVLAPRLRRLSAERNALTVVDVLSMRYRGLAATFIRISGILILLIMLTTYVAAQLTAAAKTFEATFDWNYFVGVLAGAAVVLIYTTVGGFRAVAWTDVVQATLMILSVLLLPLLLVLQLAGFGALWESLDSVKGAALTDPFADNSGMALFSFFALWLGIPLGNPGQPHVLVRFMAIRADRAIRRGAIITMIWLFVLYSGAVLLGLAARACYGSLPDSEKILPLVASEFLPGWLAGLMIAAVMAAVASTADSQLLVVAASISHDLLKRVFGKRGSEHNRVLLHRTTVFAFGVVASLIALSDNRTIFHFVLYAWAGLGAGIGPGLILSLLWRRTTGWGVFAGMLVGFTSAVLWVEIPALKQTSYEMVPAFLLASLNVWLVSLATNDG